MDAPGEAQRAEAAASLRGTDDVYRRVKSAMPDPHLVASVLVVRWWTVDELATAAPDGFEPHRGRAPGALHL